MVPRHIINRAQITPAQATLYDEIEQLLQILKVRSNRDKLLDREFLLAGSLLERWKWNASAISDDDLQTFLASVRDLVRKIEAANRRANPKKTASRTKPKPAGTRNSSAQSQSRTKRATKN